MSRVILVLFLALCQGVAFAVDTILVVGDSLSAGYGMRQEQAWPSVLQRSLDKRRLPYQVANASISGDTSAGGLSRLPAGLARHAPRVVIIALGANDGLRGLPPARLRDNLVAMSALARGAGAQVIFAGMDMPPNYGQAYREKFRKAYADAAASEKALLIPFLLAGFAERREFFQADGIHPGADAQPLIVDTVWTVLAPLVQASRVAPTPASAVPGHSSARRSRALQASRQP